MTERDTNNYNKEKDFIAECDKILRKNSAQLSTKDVCSIVAAGPAPRYYVSAFEAIKQYGLYKKTGSVNFNRKSSVRMYESLLSKFDEEFNKLPNKDSFHRHMLMSRIINGGAPSFFLEEDTALKFYYRAMSHMRRRSRR